MSYKNKVFQKLFETKEVELSKEAVELGLMQDFEKGYKKATDPHLRSYTLRDTAKGFISDAINIKKDALAAYKAIINDRDKLETTANELGIDLPKDLAIKVRDVKANMQDAESELKSLQKAFSII